MRPRDTIVEDLFQGASRNGAILEVLLDVRELLLDNRQQKNKELK